MRFIKKGIETWKRIQRQGRSPSGKVFLEVGTGWMPLVPLAYWLMGADSTITIDINPYLKEGLIAETLKKICEDDENIRNLFGSFLDRRRYDDLLDYAKKNRFSVTEFLELCRIIYIAPGDAAKTNLPENSIDFHTSYNVLALIPPSVLVDILREGNRIMKMNGLFVHRVDYADHFSFFDKSISAINFLQYSDDEWAKYAGNKYTYVNRLRHDDFLSLFESVGHKILYVEPTIDKGIEEVLRNSNFHLHERFRTKPKEILEITSAWIVTEKKPT